MDKKGFESEELGKFLFFVASAVVIIIVVTLLIKGFGSKTESEVCRLSVLGASVEKTLKLGREPSLDLNCKTETKVYELSKEDLINELVKDMADCSYQYVGGEIDFLTSFWNYFEGSQICFVCYIDTNEIEYTLDARELSNKFNRYLREIKQERVLLYTNHILENGLVVSKDNPLLIVSRFTKSAYAQQFGIRHFSIIPVNSENEENVKSNVRDLCGRIKIFS